jgi:hypothetical protein
LVEFDPKGLKMRWVGRLMTSVAAVLLTTGGVSASTTEIGTPADTAWAAAAKSDSLEAYAAFVMAYPESDHARAAYTRLLRTGTTATGAVTVPKSGPLFGSETSSPGILPGTIMII